LVAARKINADQKAQILNKPKLQESLAQLEEQISQYKKFDQEYKARMLSEKADFEKTFTEKSAKELEASLAAAKSNAEAEAVKEQHASLLLISQFLRLAAIRRGDEEADATLDENKALEGVLAKVYTGDEEAVQTMLKIIQGSEEKTVSVTSEGLSTSCKYDPSLLLDKTAHEY
jgi:D-Tyr-tRNAtyr deacylase